MLCDTAGKVVPVTFSGRLVLGWTQKSLHSSTGPFPTLTLGFTSLNGVWLLQGYRNCSEAWAQPQGEARTPPELVPASTPTKQWGWGPTLTRQEGQGPEARIFCFALERTVLQRT